MKTQKMSLANIKGKLSRAEMKNIMAGSGTTYHCTCYAPVFNFICFPDTPPEACGFANGCASGQFYCN